MTSKTAVLGLEMDAGDAIGVGALGLGAGLAARTVKRLLELQKGKDFRPPVDLPKVNRPIVKMPVQVTADEAVELERQGQKVRRLKAAIMNKAAAMSSVSDYLVGGGLLAGGAYGGWKLLDNHFDAQRRELAKKKLDAARSRVAGLLNNRPGAIDIPLHAQMKAAEDHFFDKRANWFSDAAGTVLNEGLKPIAPLALPVGLFGALLAAKAFNKSDRANKYRQGTSAIKDFYNRRSVQSPDAELEPVLVEETPKDKDPIAAAQPIPKLAAMPVVHEADLTPAQKEMLARRLDAQSREQHNQDRLRWRKNPPQFLGASGEVIPPPKSFLDDVNQVQPGEQERPAVPAPPVIAPHTNAPLASKTPVVPKLAALGTNLKARLHGRLS